MSLELHMVPQLEQDVYLIPEYELSRVLTATSPFRGSIPTKDVLLGYLTKVNGSLKERCEERQELYECYITAASLYACARRVVHLDLPNELPQTFTSIVKQRPYRLKKPFDVIMKREDDTELEAITALFDAQLAELDADVPHDLQEIYTPSELVKRKIALGLRTTANEISHEYEQDKHLLFVTLWDICFPLFGMQQKTSPEYRQLSLQLRETYGSFCLKVPLCLAPLESSDDDISPDNA